MRWRLVPMASYFTSKEATHYREDGKLIPLSNGPSFTPVNLSPFTGFTGFIRAEDGAYVRSLSTCPLRSLPGYSYSACIRATRMRRSASLKL